MIRYYQIATLGFFLTTIMYFSANRNKAIEMTSNELINVVLLDSIKTLNKDAVHLREYFTIALKQDSIMKQCNKCKKLTIIKND